MSRSGKLGRYRVEYPTNDIPGFEYVGHYDDLERAGQIMLETPGAGDIYDTVERRYIDPLDIDCVFEDWQKWWWGERPWFARLAHRLGWDNPWPFNWTVSRFTPTGIRKERREREQRSSHHFQRPRWRRVLDFTGLT